MHSTKWSISGKAHFAAKILTLVHDHAAVVSSYTTILSNVSENFTQLTGIMYTYHQQQNEPPGEIEPGKLSLGLQFRPRLGYPTGPAILREEQLGIHRTETATLRFY